MQKNVNDGCVYVVDMDLEKFFDTVSQSELIEVLSRTVKDGRLISLIHKYLNAGVIANGKFERTEIGLHDFYCAYHECIQQNGAPLQKDFTLLQAVYKF